MTFPWPKQVTEPIQNQAEEKKFHLVMEEWPIPIAQWHKMGGGVAAIFGNAPLQPAL